MSAVLALLFVCLSYVSDFCGSSQKCSISEIRIVALLPVDIPQPDTGMLRAIACTSESFEKMRQWPTSWLSRRVHRVSICE